MTPNPVPSIPSREAVERVERLFCDNVLRYEDYAILELENTNLRAEVERLTDANEMMDIKLQAALFHLLKAWQPIETAPKDGRYIIIAEIGVVPDIAAWHKELPGRIDSSGNTFLSRPEGWFNVSRSRLHPAYWLPLPEIKVSP
jgi:hypothetical protein